jgi:CHAT domain-containing protein
VPRLLPELLAPRPRRGQPTLLLAGGIDFGAARRGAAEGEGRLPVMSPFAPLRGTESEVNDLEKRFRAAFGDAPAPVVLSEEEATKAAFLKGASKARYLHLATHGFFASESEPSALAAATRSGPLRGEVRLRAEVSGRHPGLLSGVVFAGVNDAKVPAERAVLTALEASELELGNAELVTLSACDTGRGRTAGGEGVLGLQRAFQVAGARSVVASLWKVPDEHTHQLMREFYRRVWADKPVGKAEALRQAQLWMLENYKGRGLERKKGNDTPLSPQYWAAFVLSGDWR